MKVNILGTPYTILKESECDKNKMDGGDGYCETYSKEIVLAELEESDKTLSDIDKYMKKVLRHEIIHAFLHESGLAFNCEWARNEEVVDWIALQFPKLRKAFEDAKCD